MIVFGSPLSSRDSIFDDHKEILDLIKGENKVNYIFPEDLGRKQLKGATMVFVGSGGVEEMVKMAIDKLPSYVILIADGLKNSLPASLEILSWMRLEGRQGRVIHGDYDYMMQEINIYIAGYQVLDKLPRMRVGVIGKPSGWLIASNVDYSFIHNAWKERKHSAKEIIDDLEKKSRKITDADIEFFQPPSIPGYGAASGFELRLLDKTGNNDYHQMEKVSKEFVRELNKRPEIGSAFTFYSASYPQYMLRINNDIAEQKGVTIGSAMSFVEQNDKYCEILSKWMFEQEKR